jgi:sulfite exporter TauE/SafE
MKVLLGLFALGLSFGSGPCLVSCGPVFLSYLAGNSKNVAQSFLRYLVFSLSRISVYLIFSALIFYLGRFFAQRVMVGFEKITFLIGGVFIILLGVLTAFGFKLQNRLCKILKANFLERDIKSMVLLGLVIGLLPCAPLIALLTYAGFTAGTLGKSVLYGLIFGLGTFFSPLLILSLAAGFIPRIIKGREETYGRVFNIICGLTIVYLGLEFLKRAIG